MKKQLVTTAAVFSIVLGGTVLPASTAHAVPSANVKTGQHGGFEKLKTALGQVNLSASQQTQIAAILSDAKSKIASAKGAGPASTGNKSVMKSVIRATVEKVVAVLTPPQRIKLKELMKPGK